MSLRATVARYRSGVRGHGEIFAWLHEREEHRRWCLQFSSAIGRIMAVYASDCARGRRC